MSDEIAITWPIEAIIKTRKLSATVELLTAEIKSLKEQIEWYKRQMFGRKSERFPFNPNQQSFPFLIDAIENRPAVEPVPATEHKVAAHTRRVNPHGRGILPEHLERKVTVIDIPEEQKTLPDGRERPLIGHEDSEKLAFEPSRFYVNVTRRLKYGSPAGASECGVVTAEAPDTLLPRCLADDTTLTYVAMSKYGDHLPAYRLESIFKRAGVRVPRQTICDWLLALGMALAPLVAIVKQKLFETGMIYSDDTPVDLLETDGRKVKDKRIREGRIWIATAEPRDGPWTVFDFTASREAAGPKNFFADYSGKITCDAYSGYSSLVGDADGNRNIVIYGCWAHARRYCFDAYKGDDPKNGAEFLSMIRQLYDIEAEVKDADEAEILRQRQSRSVPILTAIREKVDELLPVAPPKSKMGKALKYLSHWWERLTRYANDPQARIDNNTAENGIRPIALGRKNWLFIGNRRAGEAAANIMSLIATCKRAGVEPQAWLLDVIRRMPAMRLSELPSLLDPLRPNPPLAE